MMHKSEIRWMFKTVYYKFLLFKRYSLLFLSVITCESSHLISVRVFLLYLVDRFLQYRDSELP